MLSDLHSGWQPGHARRDFRHRSKLTCGVLVPAEGQRCSDSGYFICDAAVHAKSACGFKRRLGEFTEDKSIKAIIYHGSISAAEGPQAASSWRMGECFGEVSRYASHCALLWIKTNFIRVCSASVQPSFLLTVVKWLKCLRVWLY